MTVRSHPLTLGCRVTSREQARVDAAARLRGLTRSEYLRLAVLGWAERDLRREFSPDPAGPMKPADSGGVGTRQARIPGGGPDQ